MYATLQRYAASLVLFAAVLAVAGCSSQEDAVVRAWTEYQRASNAADAPAVRSLMAAGVAPELSGPDGAAALELRSALAPVNPTVTGVEVSGSTARLRLSGVVEGRSMSGEVAFVEESGSWKVRNESWNVDLTETFPAPNVNLALELSDSDDAPPRPATEISAHEGAVTKVAFTRDGRHIVSIGYDDSRLRLWDAATGALLDDVEQEARPSDLALSTDGSSAYVVDTSGRLTEWPVDATGFGEALPFAGLAGPTPRVAVDTHGRYAVTTSWDDPAKLWDLRARVFVRTLPESDRMRGVAFSPATGRVACGSHADFFVVWNLERLSWPFGARKTHSVPRVSEQSDVHSIAFSHDGKRLATGHMDASITIWDMERGRQLHNWYVPERSTMDVAFSPCGTVLATAQQDGNVHLWEADNRRGLSRLEAHQGAANSVAFNPADGVTLATGGEDGIIRVWR